ncbi:hypothetical protein HPB50_004248 [Hyalomma asiaticum]|uniref:Uncharacterized protein n=1 Tax=Hyalomma asiaticum TaxID=266040 RepID=A0ACB7TE69_HYAAI|nr:hypothetical protein HPB50_004248 [Hyalomma asiaticum]
MHWARRTHRGAQATHNAGSEGHLRSRPSRSCLVTFEGKRVPRHVYCSDQVIPVRLYKKTVPACHRCGTVGHRADICPRPQSGRCGRCGSQVATTPEGPAEHECTPRCLICGGSHLTGAAECRDKYRKPIKPRLPPSNTKRTSAPKGTPSAGVNNKKKSPSTPGKPGQVKATDNAETRKQAPPFNAWDFPSLENAQTKVSGWVGAASKPLSPSPTEVALQRQNAELRCHTEILAKKIHELEAKLARLVEPQAQAGSSEPMQQTEPENLDDRASVASGLSSDSQCTAISVGNMPIMENRKSVTKEEKVQQILRQMHPQLQDLTEGFTFTTVKELMVVADGLMQRAWQCWQYKPLPPLTNQVARDLAFRPHMRPLTFSDHDQCSDSHCGYNYVYHNAPGIPLATTSCSCSAIICPGSVMSSLYRPHTDAAVSPYGFVTGRPLAAAQHTTSDCQRCRGIGHVARQCATARQNVPPMCFYCGQPGYMRAECPGNSFPGNRR